MERDRYMLYMTVHLEVKGYSHLYLCPWPCYVYTYVYYCEQFTMSRMWKSSVQYSIRWYAIKYTICTYTNTYTYMYLYMYHMHLLNHHA